MSISFKSLLYFTRFVNWVHEDDPLSIEARKSTSRLEASKLTQNKEEPMNNEKVKNVKQGGEKLRNRGYKNHKV